MFFNDKKTSEYANRNCTVRTIGYCVIKNRNGWSPVLCGKEQDDYYESPWRAMRAAQSLAKEKAEDLRRYGVRARAVLTSNCIS